MSEDISTAEWKRIGQELRAPFHPDEVDFRVLQVTKAGDKAQCAAYLDARTVADRLDEVVGPGGWSFTWEPLGFDKNGAVTDAKGRLTLYGVAKEDVGGASNQENTKGAVSDALKRAAVLWGVGRYLYSLGRLYAPINEYKQITPDGLKQMRARLPRPSGSTSPRVYADAESAGGESDEAVAPTRHASPARSDPAPAASPDGGMNRQAFLLELGKLGLTPQEGMALAGVRSLDNLNLKDALRVIKDQQQKRGLASGELRDAPPLRV